MTAWTMYALYGAFALGAVGIYFALPKARNYRPLPGAVLAITALVVLLVAMAVGVALPGRSNGLFYVLAAVALIATGRVITHRDPVYSAVYFVLVVVSVAAMCLLQQAEFLAVALIIVYAGAILVTYVFVIMLAHQGGRSVADRQSREPFWAVCAGFLAMGVVAVQTAGFIAEEQESEATSAGVGPGVRLVADDGASDSAAASEAEDGSAPAVVRNNTLEIGAVVMGRYVVALEIGGVLLLVAMVGAVAMSRKKVPTEAPAAGPPVPLGEVGRHVEPF